MLVCVCERESTVLHPRYKDNAAPVCVCEWEPAINKIVKWNYMLVVKKPRHVSAFYLQIYPALGFQVPLVNPI